MAFALRLKFVLLICVFVVEILPSLVLAQRNGIVTVGSTLTATEDQIPWVSPSGDFAFGFKKLQSTNLFLLSIWYRKLPEETIVWYTNADHPSTVGSTLELTADRGLVLMDPQGQETAISNTIINRINNGFINDTGNFLLQNGNSETLWETFGYPTDTILPQMMPRQIELNSRRAETNFSRGRFQLTLSRTGSIQLSTINVPSSFKNSPYYENTNESFGPSQLGDQVNEFYYRATLEYDGVFSIYRRRRNSTDNETWSTVKVIPDNICLSSIVDANSGVCGYNRICTLKDNKRPDCQCPQRAFTLVDPDDEYRGCVQNFVQTCGDDYVTSAENQYDFYEFSNMDWPIGDYEQLDSYDEELCKISCLFDCLCSVAIARSNTCWKKRLPLSNGRNDGRLNGKAFIKFNKNNPQSNPNNTLPNGKSQNTIILLISVFLGSSVLVNFILFGGILFGFFIIYRNKETPKNVSVLERSPCCFTYKELVNATNGFKEELGRGSFGTVYKGEINLGSNTVIAVKRLYRIAEESNREFKTEVNVIGQTHHKNLVKLIGFCDEGSHRLLVYEFLPNLSLASFLFGNLKLCWSQRVKIAIGIAKGLQYLHEECETPIIHCDIKPQNILLDDYYNARISDFGLAKLLSIDQSETQTNIRGTKGYVAPEWFRNMPVTVKTDVYSFGVLLLEIICCRRNVDMEAGRDREILTYWAYDCFTQGMTDIHILVENDSEAIGDRDNLQKFVMVALWCTQEDPSLRPNMKKVVLMLEGIVEVTSPPCPKPFSSIGIN